MKAKPVPSVWCRFKNWIVMCVTTQPKPYYGHDQESYEGTYNSVSCEEGYDEIKYRLDQRSPAWDIRQPVQPIQFACYGEEEESCTEKESFEGSYVFIVKCCDHTR